MDLGSGVGEFKMFVWAAGGYLSQRLVLVCARTGKVRVKNHRKTYKCLEERGGVRKNSCSDNMRTERGRVGVRIRRVGGGGDDDHHLYHDSFPMIHFLSGCSSREGTG